MLSRGLDGDAGGMGCCDYEKRMIFFPTPSLLEGKLQPKNVGGPEIAVVVPSHPIHGGANLRDPRTLPESRSEGCGGRGLWVIMSAASFAAVAGLSVREM